MVRKAYLLLLLALITPLHSHAEDDELELKTTIIKGNKELPKILYVVPWKEIKPDKKEKRKLVLHSLFGDLFEPMLPEQSIAAHKINHLDADKKPK